MASVATEAIPWVDERFSRRSVLTCARIMLVGGLSTFGVQLSGSGSVQVEQAARTSGPVRLTVRLGNGHRQFRPGETIPIELEFDSFVPNRFVVDGGLYDRSGRLTVDEFRIEPNEFVTDPFRDYFGLGGGPLGGIRTTGVLGNASFTVRLELNDWLRFDKPGTYMLSVLSRRVTDDAQTNQTERVVVPVESNTVSFEILPRNVEWEATALGDALQILNSSTSGRDARTACRLLRFLATDIAVDEMIKRYDGQSDCDFEYTAGLFGAPNRARVVRQLENGLRATDQAVSWSYLRTLALLSVYVDHPELRPAQTRDTKGRQVASDEPRRLHDLVQAAETTYEQALDVALPEKTARARAVTLAWRLESSQRQDSTSATASLDQLRDQLVGTFLELSVDRQTTLLQFRWPALAGSAMLPVLRRLVESSKSPSLADLALRRLYELAPEEGRVRIVREIMSPSPRASLKTLGILPDAELPELDEALARNLDTAHGFDAVSIHAELLQRYASPAVLEHVLARFGDRLTGMQCRPQSALLAYFIRADHYQGSTLLDRALESRAKTDCYKFALGNVAAFRMTPTLEAAAVAHLDDPDPQVVFNAVETLGRYGSRASQQALRSRFETWHQAWTGRQEDLRYSRAQDRPDAVQGMVESAFLQSLGRGQAWLTRKRDMLELRKLCVTDGCRTQATYLIDSADGTRISMSRLDDPNNSLITLAQYQLPSIPTLEQKLSQYPKGTSFTLDVSSLDPQIAPAIASRVTRFAEEQGMKVRKWVQD